MTKAPEEGTNVDNVGCRIKIIANNITQVGGDMLKIFDNLIDDFYKPTRSSATSLWYDEPLEELGRCAEDGDGDGLLPNCDLGKRRDEVEQGEDAAFVERFKKLFKTWDVKLSKAADLVDFLIVYRCPNATVLLGNDHQQAREGRSRMLC